MQLIKTEKHTLEIRRNKRKGLKLSVESSEKGCDGCLFNDYRKDICLTWSRMGIEIGGSKYGGAFCCALSGKLDNNLIFRRKWK
jgi:hypothetical protein